MRQLPVGIPGKGTWVLPQPWPDVLRRIPKGFDGVKLLYRSAVRPVCDEIAPIRAPQHQRMLCRPLAFHRDLAVDVHVATVFAERFAVKCELGLPAAVQKIKVVSAVKKTAVTVRRDAKAAFLRPARLRRVCISVESPLGIPGFTGTNLLLASQRVDPHIHRLFPAFPTRFPSIGKEHPVQPADLRAAVYYHLSCILGQHPLRRPVFFQ